MVKKMNKREFIEELSKRLDMNKDTCRKISDTLEENFFIGKKNMEKTINNLMTELNVDREKAEEIFNICMDTMKDAIKDKIKHPFRSQD